MTREPAPVRGPLRVSVVIPTHNRREAVLRALASVVAQTRAVDEIVVIDDGSTDGSAEAIRGAFPHVNVIEQPNCGVSAARNRGIAATSAEWIAFLDSDDAWQPHKIERQLAVLAAQPDARLCHTDEIWVRNGRRVNARLRHTKGGGWIYRNCLELCVISPSAAIVRRDVFAEIGAFDETLPVCEDYDLWLRLCSREPVVYVDAPLVIKTGGHADQLSRRYWGMDRFRIAALQSMLANERLTPADRDATIEVLRRKIEIYVAGARKRRKHDEVEQYTRMLERLTTPASARRHANPHRGTVNIVVAFPAEARPLLEHFRLHPVEATGSLRVHANDWMQLIVAGAAGKVAASAAVGYLAGRNHTRAAAAAAWINVGIGGHRELPLGSVRIAHRVTDRADGKCWYPQPTFRLSCGSSDVATVDVPEAAYADDAIYDMEASAFYQACLRHTTAELVQVVKCVSDNRNEPLRHVTPAAAERWVHEALPHIEAAVDALSVAAAGRQRLLADPPELDVFLQRWHFTVTQVSQLRDTLRRWHLVHVGRPALDVAARERTSRAVLQALRRNLEALPTQIGPSAPEIIA